MVMLSLGEFEAPSSMSSSSSNLNPLGETSSCVIAIKHFKFLHHQLLQFMKPHLPKGVQMKGHKKMRSIQEIYDETEIINDFFCLFVDSEPLTFDEAMEDKRWRQAMEEEIKAIKKNDTWELSNLPK
ncbi:hypothetical protein CR513_35376, partial [Mucuna pruriens]